ncbi:MAG: PDR/VanB family oxidoreductase [Rhizobiaceae bacterium]|nr:PDR/VanB family oxidoreductase [Rhizobiaceae bacterium]MCV0407113.1 PDR/VanB family oxidoreductase [Rhizobiaceae bacterium]
MRVVARRKLARHVDEFTLRAGGNITLPSYEPGAHVTVRTPSGAMRRYSLIGGADRDTYTIAVKREAESRGGSRSMHQDAEVGTELMVAPPENEFALVDAPDYLLIAGGIGVTPIYAMARHLLEKGTEFRVIYVSRNAEEAAYLDEMRAAFGDRLVVHHDDGDPDRAYDFWDEFEKPRPTHVYCCGPKPLMEEIEAMSGHWPEGRIHFEDFKPVEIVRADDQPFEVELARSKMRVQVPADRSILEAVRDSGIRTSSSCESGTCGSCKTRLIAGDVDHRDMVLRDDEKDDTIMICVSRARTGTLILDL